MGMQRLSGAVVAFGQVPEVAYQIAQEDGRTGGRGGCGGSFCLSHAVARTHTHTHKLKESGKMIAGMVSRDGNTESCLSLRFGPWWSGGLGGGRFWALSFWESLKY